MITFLVCLGLLITGYLTYGTLVENPFGPDDRETPAIRINDGVDYVVLPGWKLFLVQLLNIAGLGPIFGPLTGAIWGPIVFLWITFGTIFAGGVHDYFSGMLSERNDGASISEVTGTYLGPVMKNVMRVFAVVLLVLIGTVFAVGPAGLIFAFLGEVIGTGIIGAVLSYPVMTAIWGRTGLSWFFYVPSFIAGTLIGGGLAFFMLKQMQKAGLVRAFQNALGSKVYSGGDEVMNDAIGIGVLGLFAYLACVILGKHLTTWPGVWVSRIKYVVLAAFFLAGGMYWMRNRGNHS